MALVAVTYLVACGVGLGWLLLGPDSRWLLLDSLVADLLATLVIFAVSRTMRNSSFYDAWWSVAPPLLVLYWWLVREEGTDGWRAALLGTVIAVWAVRLTANWVRGYPGHPHEDWRYELLRSRAPRFELVVDLMAIHVIPTIQVFVALIPAYVAVSVGTRPLSLARRSRVRRRRGSDRARDPGRPRAAHLRRPTPAGRDPGHRALGMVAAPQLLRRAVRLDLGRALRRRRLARRLVVAA